MGTPPDPDVVRQLNRFQKILHLNLYVLGPLGQIFLWVFLFTAIKPASGGSATLLAPDAIIIVLLLATVVIDVRRRVALWRVLVSALLVLSMLVNIFTYYYLAYGTTANWGMPLSRLDALYVAVGTLSGVGASGITPHTQFARGLLTLQMGLDVVVVTTIFGIVVSRMVDARRREPT